VNSHNSVTEYSTKTAILTLEHNHPLGNKLKALVDVKLLVNTLKSTDTRVGEWVNVIGYISMTWTPSPSRNTIPVQAIVLWTSGPLKLDGYERVLDVQKVDRTTNNQPG
jgi:hypothetical protein